MTARLVGVKRSLTFSRFAFLNTSFCEYSDWSTREPTACANPPSNRILYEKFIEIRYLPNLELRQSLFISAAITTYHSRVSKQPLEI